MRMTHCAAPPTWRSRSGATLRGLPGYVGAAQDLRRRFGQDSGLAEADFPALALDGERRQARALASDAGHLLWSRILDQDRAQRVALRLLQSDFFSGWGVRTLAAGQAPYHPLSVPPRSHLATRQRGDRSGHGSARTHGGGTRGRSRAGWPQQNDQRLWATRGHLWLRTGSTSAAPVPYPHSCSPQAWAAATPLALLTATVPPLGARWEPRVLDFGP